MTKFNIIKNNLYSDGAIKSLKLENDDFKIKIWYYGDYNIDRLQNKCEPSNITMSIKPKKDCMDISYLNGELGITIPYYSYLAIDDIDMFVEQLTKTKENLIAIQKILDEMFFIKK